MTAAIICPGPSMPLTIPHADLTVGVNRAAIALRCDAWCAGDAPRIIESGPLVMGSPILFTTREASATPWRSSVAIWEDLWGYLHPGVSRTAWSRFSMMAAIVFAAWRGATEITCYGCDWAGLKDFDGVEAGASRDGDRWKQEAEIFVNLQRELARLGTRLGKSNE